MNLNELAAELMVEPSAENATPEPEKKPNEAVNESDITNEEEEVVEEEVEETVSEVEDDEDSQEAEDDSEAPWMPQDLNELAEAMNVDVDDLGSIRLKTKVDGVEGEATLRDVIKSYQLEKSLTKRSEAFAAEQKAFKEQQESLTTQFDERLAVAEKLTMLMEERLKGDISGIDWDTLRQENPAQFAVLKQDFIERIGEVESVKQNIISQREKDLQKQREEFVERHKAFVKENAEKLVEAVPSFKDEEVRRKELGELRNYLKTQSISEQEIAQISDYRILLLARKAKAFDDMQTKANPAKAKAKSAPKFTKPSARKTKAQVAHDEFKAKANRLKSTGKVKDLAALLLESGDF